MSKSSKFQLIIPYNELIAVKVGQAKVIYLTWKVTDTMVKWRGIRQYINVQDLEKTNTKEK